MTSRPCRGDGRPPWVSIIINRGMSQHLASASIQPLESVRQWFIVGASRGTKVGPDALHRPLSVPHEFYPDN
jgi:hypothetical protein